MNAPLIASVPGNPAPQPGRDGAVGSRTESDAGERQLAWQREMERAQLSAWFKPTPRASEHKIADPETRTTKTGNRRHADEPRSRGPLAVAAGHVISAMRAMETPAIQPLPACDGMATGMSSVQAASRRQMQRGDGAQGLHSAPGGAAAFVLQRGGTPSVLPSPKTVLESESIADATSPRLSSTPFASEPPALIRLHAESRPEGQAVWLAMRANDSALNAMLPGIVADLQRGLRDRGERLHLVVCNGQPVWRDGAFLKAQGSAFDQLHSREA